MSKMYLNFLINVLETSFLLFMHAIIDLRGTSRWGWSCSCCCEWRRKLSEESCREHRAVHRGLPQGSPPV